MFVNRGVFLRDYDKRLAANNNVSVWIKYQPAIFCNVSSSVLLFPCTILPRLKVAPAGWTFDPKDWWVEEHGKMLTGEYTSRYIPLISLKTLVLQGLIMSTPGPLPRKSMKDKLVLPEKKYIVTGGRSVTTVLTVHDDGRWELEKGKLYDVTHLPCRSAAYRGETCKPQSANLKDFPVKPGAEMPAIEGCTKQDYAVLFVLGEVV